MARTERKTRYIVEYLAQTGPLKRIFDLQQKFNKSIKAGSSAIIAFSNQMQTAYAAVSASMNGLMSVAGRVGAAFGSMKTSIRNALVNTRFEVATLGAVVTGIVGKLMFGGVKAAADAEEVINRFNVSFNQVLGPATSTLEKMRTELRLGKVTLMNYLAGAQDLLVGFGATQKEALKLSDGIVRLTLDLASWNNIPFDVAMRNMLSGLVGNHEALRSMRVVLTQATLERKKEELGIKGSWKTLTEATKVYLRYRVALDQSVNALGDLQRTQQETTNRFRFFIEQVKMMYTTIFPKLTTQIGAVAEKWGVFLQNSEGSFKDLGDYLEIVGDWLNKLSVYVIDFLDRWRGLSDAQQQFLIFAGTVTALAAPILGILVIFGRALMVTSMWTAVIVGLAIVFQDIYAVMRGGNGYFKVLLDYFGVSVEQVKAFASGMWTLGESIISTVTSSGVLGQMWSGLWGVLSAIGDVLLNDVWPVIKFVWGFLSDNVGVLEPILNTLGLLVQGIVSAMGLVWSILTGNTERITFHINNLGKILVGIIVNVGKAIWDIAGAIVDLILTFGPKILQGLVSVIVNIMGQVLKGVTQGIVWLFGNIFSGVGSLFKSSFSLVGNVISFYVESYQKIFGFLIEKFGNIAGAIRDVIKSVFSGLVETVLGTINTVIDKVKGIKRLMPEWIQRRMDDTPKETEPGKLGGPPEIPTPEIPIPGGGSTTGGGTNPEPRGNGGIKIDTISMPIHLPQTFNGDPEEFRNIAYEQALKALNDAFTVTYDDNAEVV